MTVRFTDTDLGFKALRSVLDRVDGEQVVAGLLDEENATKGALNEYGTSTAQPRPWLSVAGDSLAVEAAITNYAEAVANGSSTAAVELGKSVEATVRETIEGQFVQGPPLKQSTIDRKGGRTEKLIDTGDMLAAIDSEVRSS